MKYVKHNMYMLKVYRLYVQVVQNDVRASGAKSVKPI